MPVTWPGTREVGGFGGRQAEGWEQEVWNNSARWEVGSVPCSPVHFPSVFLFWCQNLVGTAYGIYFTICFRHNRISREAAGFNCRKLVLFLFSWCTRYLQDRLRQTGMFFGEAVCRNPDFLLSGLQERWKGLRPLLLSLSQFWCLHIIRSQNSHCC